VSVTEPKRFRRCTFGVVRRITIAAALTVFALATPLVAEAKGPTLARVCGADRCASIRGPAVRAFLDWGGVAGFEQLPAPRTVPFYRLTLYDRGRPSWRLLYAPSARRVRITQLSVYPFDTVAPYWRAVPPAGTSAFSRATRGLKPFPAPRSWR
jgi:hypothetical protein